MTPNRQISYTIHKVVFLMDKLADHALQETPEITFSQFRILIAIGRTNELTQKKIAEYWDMTEAAVSRQVENLQKKKLITIHENKHNRRQHLLRLTQAGRSRLEKAFETVEKAHEKLYRDLTKEEKKIFIDVLNKILHTICGNSGNFSCDPVKGKK